MRPPSFRSSIAITAAVRNCNGKTRSRPCSLGHSNRPVLSGRAVLTRRRAARACAERLFLQTRTPSDQAGHGKRIVPLMAGAQTPYPKRYQYILENISLKFGEVKRINNDTGNQ